MIDPNPDNSYPPPKKKKRKNFTGFYAGVNPPNFNFLYA